MARRKWPRDAANVRGPADWIGVDVNESTDVPEAQDRFCLVCGERLIRSNKVGICRKTAECRRQRTRAFRALKPRARVPDHLKICTVDGCEERYKGKGLCSMHLARWHRTGDVGPAGKLCNPQTVSTGDAFGEWTALADGDRGEPVSCRCSCGTVRRVNMDTLLDGRSKSCGCRGAFRDGDRSASRASARVKRIYMKAGEVYERLTVLEDVTYSTDRAKCRCICGNLKDVKAINLRTAQVRSCGCLRRELRTVHGMSSDPTYKAWYGMIERCTNPRNSAWDHYGGRGIRVCDRWLGSPEGLFNFIADVGERPSAAYSLDRIEVNGNYEPGNVRWATADVQGENKRKVKEMTQQILALQAQVARLQAGGLT
jgi:hypothetical protein